MIVDFSAEIAFDNFFIYNKMLKFRIAEIIDCELTVNGSDFSSEFTDTGLHGVIFDDVVKRLICPFHPAFFDAVIFLF